jgi:signal transduction histidine kinase
MDPLCKQKGLALSLNLKEGLPRFKFDRDRITQVAANIVNNAIKFTDQGGITIYTNQEKDNFVTVCVQDTGPGIKEEDIPRLFQRFGQLEMAGVRKTGGTGLGLAISKEIVEKHGGKIWVESKFGQGTSFIFRLPI